MGLSYKRVCLTNNDGDITETNLSGIEVVDGRVDVCIRTEELKDHSETVSGVETKEK